MSKLRNSYPNRKASTDILIQTIHKKSKGKLSVDELEKLFYLNKNGKSENNTTVIGVKNPIKGSKLR